MRRFFALNVLVTLFVCSLLFTALAEATIRYVDAVAGTCVGNYNIVARNCTGTDGNSYATFALGIAPTVAGDTLYIRAGTWTTVWSLVGKTGTVNNYITIAGYPGELIDYRHSGQPFFDSGLYRPNYAYFIFRNIKFNGQGTNFSYLSIGNGTHDIIFDDVEVTGYKGTGIFLSKSQNNLCHHVSILNSRIHDQVIHLNEPGYRWYGIYWGGCDDGLIEGNDVYNNPGGGMQLYPGPTTNLIVRKNRIHDNNTMSSSSIGGVVLQSSGGSTFMHNVEFYENEIYNNGSAVGHGPSPGLQLGTVGVLDLKILNNDIYNNANEGIRSTGTTSNNTIIRNNISYNNGANNILISSDSVQDHNMTTDPSFVNAAAQDFHLQAGSAAINAGTAVPIRTCNDACDIGVYETFTFTGGTAVGNIATVQMNMNCCTPFVPGSAGWSVTVDVGGGDVARNVTNVALAASSGVNLTFDGAALAAGHIIKVAYNNNPGTATDFTNQPLWDTGPVTLTNLAGGASFTFTQTAWGIYAGLGAQTTTAPITHVSPGGMIAVRTKFKATGGDPPPMTTKLQCAVDDENGTYADAPDTFGAGDCPNIRYVGLGNFPGMDLHGTTTTERLTGEFSGIVSGGVLRCFVGCEVPTVDLTQDSESEQVDILEFDTDTPVDTVYWFRRVRSDGTVMTYAANSKPSITIEAPSASGIASLPQQPWGLTATPNPTWGPRPSRGWLVSAGRSLW